MPPALPTDADLVDLIVALYAPVPQGFDNLDQTGGIAWGLARRDNVDVIVCRGSKTLPDWLRDVESEGGAVLDGWPQLGLIPYGFSLGLPETYAAVKPLLRPSADIMIAGHSLGAAHAAELAGIHIVAGGEVARLMLCGCPRPGTLTLRALIERYLNPAFIRSYRNRSDPVCTVPRTIDRMLPWGDLGPFIPLDEASPLPDDLVPWHDHHSAHYAAGIHKLFAA